MKMDKLRKQEEIKYKNALDEKNSEVQVLKEMVKSSNLQLKAREKDSVRLKQKVVHLEGK